MSRTRNTKENIINETVPHNDIEEAQAASLKQQAPSLKRLRHYVTLTQDVGVRHYATLTAIHG